VKIREDEGQERGRDSYGCHHRDVGLIDPRSDGTKVAVHVSENDMGPRFCNGCFTCSLDNKNIFRA
jgi:hypothetical protein